MSSPALEQLPPPPPGRSGWPWTSESVCYSRSKPEHGLWPAITIVTPLYNQVEFIEETIRSILLQRYPSLQLIIVYKESSDGSIGVVEKYAPWLEVVHQEGAGQSAALNTGFRLARGSLVGWQNSDDVYGPDAFYYAASCARAYPDIDVFTGKVRVFWNQERHEPWVKEVCEEFSQDGLLDRMCVMNQSLFFRKSILETVSIREDMAYAMDQQFLWDLACNGFKFKSIPEMVGYYRWHGRAKSNSNIFYGDRELFQMHRRLVREKRLSIAIRRNVQTRMWTSLLSSIRRGRRNIPYKLAPELLFPIWD